MRKAGVLIPLMVLLFQASPALALEKVRLATGSRLSAITHLPVMAAEEKGLWKREGLEVQWFDLPSHRAMTQALASHSVDIGASVAIGLIQAIARGLPVTIVADLGSRYGFHFWVGPDSPLKDVRELKGARIGVFGLGAIAHSYARAVGKALGLEKDFKFVSVGGGPEVMAALKSKAVDVAVSTYVTFVSLEVKGEVRSLLSVEDYLPKVWTNHLLVARNEFLAKNLGATKGTIRTFMEAGQWVLANPQWAVEKMKTQFHYPEGTAKATFAYLRYSKDGKVNREALANVINFIAEYELLPKDKVPAPDQLYPKEFAG